MDTLIHPTPFRVNQIVFRRVVLQLGGSGGTASPAHVEVQLALLADWNIRGSAPFVVSDPARRHSER